MFKVYSSEFHSKLIWWVAREIGDGAVRCIQIENFENRIGGVAVVGSHYRIGHAQLFGELKSSVGNVSQKILTAQLRQMEESGLVDRKVYAEVPPRVEYTLTEAGYSLKPVLDAMWKWGEDYKKNR